MTVRDHGSLAEKSKKRQYVVLLFVCLHNVLAEKKGVVLCQS